MKRIVVRRIVAVDDRRTGRGEEILHHSAGRAGLIAETGNVFVQIIDKLSEADGAPVLNIVSARFVAVRLVGGVADRLKIASPGSDAVLCEEISHILLKKRHTLGISEIGGGIEPVYLHVREPLRMPVLAKRCRDPRLIQHRVARHIVNGDCSALRPCRVTESLHVQVLHFGKEVRAFLEKPLAHPEAGSRHDLCRSAACPPAVIELKALKAAVFHGIFNVCLKAVVILRQRLVLIFGHTLRRLVAEEPVLEKVRPDLNVALIYPDIYRRQKHTVARIEICRKLSVRVKCRAEGQGIVLTLCGQQSA